MRVPLLTVKVSADCKGVRNLLCRFSAGSNRSIRFLTPFPPADTFSAGPPFPPAGMMFKAVGFELGSAFVIKRR